MDAINFYRNKPRNTIDIKVAFAGTKDSKDVGLVLRK
jgi:predicted PP-loop superfamily ATPase